MSSAWSRSAGDVGPLGPPPPAAARGLPRAPVLPAGVVAPQLETGALVGAPPGGLGREVEPALPHDLAGLVGPALVVAAVLPHRHGGHSCRGRGSRGSRGQEAPAPADSETGAPNARAIRDDPRGPKQWSPVAIEHDSHAPGIEALADLFIVVDGDATVRGGQPGRPTVLGFEPPRADRPAPALELVHPTTSGSPPRPWWARPAGPTAPGPRS